MVRAAAIGMIRLYQKTLSLVLGRHCRFHPTCSEYTAQAIRAHGCWRGGWLALRRIGKCHPWSKRSGFDPVPPAGPPSETDAEQEDRDPPRTH
ncbi:MAG: membrane protein insertion efficiency factor YidD [Phycisphaerales bacterium]|nr:membrane protein insertion efficiency factor YidD [Phycisphaerales bacterium]